MWAVSRTSDLALIKADIIFLLDRQLSFSRLVQSYQSSASVMEKLFGRSISCPYRLRYLAQVA
jgi:hypothetical protein